jgi:VanZ family protein
LAAAGLGVGWLAAFEGWPYGIAAFIAAFLLWRRSGLRAQGAAVGLIYAVAASLMGPGGGAGMMRAWLEGLGWGPEAVDTTIFVFRKSVHVAGYGVMAAAAAWAIGPKTERRLTSAATAALGTAVADEWIQSFSPGRTGQVSDVAIDAVGIALGLALFSWGVRRRG